jgi:hypothetical protein
MQRVDVEGRNPAADGANPTRSDPNADNNNNHTSENERVPNGAGERGSNDDGGGGGAKTARVAERRIDRFELENGGPRIQWFLKWEWSYAKRSGWFGVSLSVATISCILLIALTTHYALQARHSEHELAIATSPSTSHATTSLPVIALTTAAAADVKPLPDSRVAAAADVLRSDSSPSGDTPKEQVVYIGADSQICIRTKESGTWWSSVQCVENAHPKANSPITILDWLGGPSIYFIDTDNHLAGIDNSPTNDTWSLSLVAESKTQVHNMSQLASVTWLNYTSSWLYYQGVDGEMQEFGIDDYRDRAWRGGSFGGLGGCQPGSGIGASRWVNGSDEVLEVFCQVISKAIQGRVFAQGVWNADRYSVDSTGPQIPDGTSLASMTINDGNGSIILLAYMMEGGFVTVQTRRAENPDPEAFSSPVQVAEGDGQTGTGLTALGWLQQARLYFLEGEEIVELSSSNSTVGRNWTTVTIPW